MKYFFHFPLLANIYNILKYYSIVFIKLIVLKIIKPIVTFQAKLYTIKERKNKRKEERKKIKKVGKRKEILDMWETWVPSLSWGDHLEQGMATHSSILAWRIPMDRGAWQATPTGCKESDMTEQ